MRSLFQTRSTLVAALLALLTACAAEPGADVALESNDQKASYGIGFNVGQGIVPVGDRIDISAFAMGLRDALDEADPAIPEEELAEILQAFQMDLQQAQQEAMSAEAEQNQVASDSFMQANGQRAGVTTTESGLQYEVVEAGDGPTPGPEDQVTLHYRGTLPDGTEFDSSYDNGEPATFGLTNVIPGFAEGLQLMSVGSTYRLFVPPELGYGTRATGPIPANSALTFEVELLEIVE